MHIIETFYNPDNNILKSIRNETWSIVSFIYMASNNLLNCSKSVPIFLYKTVYQYNGLVLRSCP